MYSFHIGDQVLDVSILVDVSVSAGRHSEPVKNLMYVRCLKRDDILYMIDPSPVESALVAMFDPDIKTLEPYDGIERTGFDSPIESIRTMFPGYATKEHLMSPNPESMFELDVNDIPLIIFCSVFTTNMQKENVFVEAFRKDLKDYSTILSRLVRTYYLLDHLISIYGYRVNLDGYFDMYDLTNYTHRLLNEKGPGFSLIARKMRFSPRGNITEKLDFFANNVSLFTFHADTIVALSLAASEMVKDNSLISIFTSERYKKAFCIKG